VGGGAGAAGGPKLADGLLDRIVVGDTRRDLDHLGERPVGDPLAVREAAAGEDRRSLDTGQELAREAALADTWVAVDREEVGTLVALCAREGVGKQLDLLLPPDERRADPHRA